MNNKWIINTFAHINLKLKSLKLKVKWKFYYYLSIYYYENLRRKIKKREAFFNSILLGNTHTNYNLDD